MDLLGLAAALSVIVTLAVPAVAPARLRHILLASPLPSDLSVQVAAQADCLWMAARNNGFYDIQYQAVNGHASDSERRLWTGFIESTGRHDCGLVVPDMSELGDALESSLPDAERHFRGLRHAPTPDNIQRKEPSTVAERI